MKSLLYALALGALSAALSAVATFAVESAAGKGALIVAAIAVSFAAQTAAVYNFDKPENTTKEKITP